MTRTKAHAMHLSASVVCHGFDFKFGDFKNRKYLYLFVYDLVYIFSSLALHIGWLQKLFRKVDMMGRYSNTDYYCYRIGIPLL